jgi:hypothetical protein
MTNGSTRSFDFAISLHLTWICRCIPKKLIQKYLETRSMWNVATSLIWQSLFREAPKLKSFLSEPLTFRLNIGTHRLVFRLLLENRYSLLASYITRFLPISFPSLDLSRTHSTCSKRVMFDCQRNVSGERGLRGYKIYFTLNYYTENQNW